MVSFLTADVWKKINLYLPDKRTQKTTLPVTFVVNEDLLPTQTYMVYRSGLSLFLAVCGSKNVAYIFDN